MGHGYPRIPNRSAFGPTFENKHPVRDAEKELDAATMNLLAWQVAGASRTLPRALLVYNGITGAVSYHVESWATHGTGATAMGPVATKTATGNYSFTFGGAFPDEAGATATFTPRAALAFPQGVTGVVGPSTSISGQRVDVRLRTAAGSGVNASVLVGVW